MAGGRFNSQIPLFGSYMFLFANEEERVKALTTQRFPAKEFENSAE
jgi:hypothetical protein